MPTENECFRIQPWRIRCDAEKQWNRAEGLGARPICPTSRQLRCTIGIPSSAGGSVALAYSAGAFVTATKRRIAEAVPLSRATYFRRSRHPCIPRGRLPEGGKFRRMPRVVDRPPQLRAPPRILANEKRRSPGRRSCRPPSCREGRRSCRSASRIEGASSHLARERPRPLVPLVEHRRLRRGQSMTREDAGLAREAPSNRRNVLSLRRALGSSVHDWARHGFVVHGAGVAACRSEAPRSSSNCPLCFPGSEGR